MHEKAATDRVRAALRWRLKRAIRQFETRVQSGQSLYKVAKSVKDKLSPSVEERVREAARSCHLVPAVDQLNVKLKIDRTIEDKDFLFFISSIDGKPVRGISLGEGWSYSSRVAGMYHYVEANPKGKIIKLPPIRLGHAFRRIRWGIIPWSEKAVRLDKPEIHIRFDGMVEPGRGIKIKRVIRREEV